MLSRLLQDISRFFNGKPEPPTVPPPVKERWNGLPPWTVIFPSNKPLVFHPIWSVGPDDPDLVRWCRSARGRAGPHEAAAILQEWLYIARAEAEGCRPHVMLVVGGGPLFVIEEGTGVILRQSRRAVEPGIVLGQSIRPGNLVGEAQKALLTAVRSGRPATWVPEDDLGAPGSIPLVAPKTGLLRLYDALPPSHAPDRNVWWKGVSVDDTSIAVIAPEAASKIVTAVFVTHGQVLGWFSSAQVCLHTLNHNDPVRARSSGRTTRQQALPGFEKVARKFVDKAIAETARRARPDVVEAASPFGVVDLDLFRWLTAGGQAEAQRVRHQALQAFPILCAVISQNGLRKVEPLTDGIDSGRELTPVLAQHLGASEPAVRAVARLRVKPLGRTRFRLLATGALAAAATLPPDLLPGRGVAPREREWRVFLDLYDFMQKGRGRLLEWQTLTAGGALWSRVTQKEAPGVRGRAAHVVDCLYAAWQDLLLPNLAALAWQQGARVPRRQVEQVLDLLNAGRILRADRGFASLEALARRWDHNRRAIAGAAIRVRTENVEWLPLTPEFRHEQTGLVVTPLTSAAALEAEGKAQRNCLDAGYAEVCLFGQFHIVAIRDEKGKSVSTAEIEVADDGREIGLQVSQHFAAENELPPDLAEQALSDYLDAILSGSIEVEWDTLVKALEGRCRARFGQTRQGYRYRLDDPETADRVFEAWRFLLPSPQRQMTRAAWVDAAGLPAMAATLVTGSSGGPDAGDAGVDDDSNEDTA